jgi:hypothetical protein
MKRPLIAALLIALAVLMTHGSVPAQDPDPLTLPFPKAQSLKELGDWCLAAQRSAHAHMVAARAKGDRAQVCHVLNRLDKVRQHAARLFGELQATGSGRLRP